MIMMRAMEDTSSGANAINGAASIRIKLSTGAWGTDDILAMTIVDNQWLVATDAKEGGTAQVADNIDVSSVVTGNGTFNLRFEDIQADGANLNLIDFQVGVRVYFL